MKRLLAVLTTAALAATLCVGLPAAGAGAAVPPGWSGPTSLDPAHAPLVTISCPTSTFCVAGDQKSNAYTWDNGTFSRPTRLFTNAFDTKGPGILSVSCPTTSFCAATDGAGNAFTYHSGTWSAPTAVTDQPLWSVSCPTTTWCMTVDQAGYVSRYDGATWSTKSLPTGGGSGPRYISCPTTTFCLSVAGTKDFVYNAGTWSDTPASGLGPSQYSVSCTSPTFCMAQGNNGFSDGTAIFNGTTWSAPTGGGGGRHLSCASASYCVATTFSGSTSTYNGSTWTAPATIPSSSVGPISCATTTFCAGTGFVTLGGAKSDDGAFFTDVNDVWSAGVPMSPPGGGAGTVSCASPEFCTFVTPALAASSFDGSNWTYERFLDPAATDSTTVPFASCPEVNFCMAVDSGGDALTFDGSAWSAPSLIVPGGYGLAALSCSSATFCAAATGGDMLTYNGTSWTTPTTLPGSSPYVTSISCVSATFCIAMGDHKIPYRYNGSSWTAGPQDVGDAVSCASTTFCLATYAGGSVKTYNGSSWTTYQKVTNDSADISALDCLSATFCAVADVHGNAYFGRPGAWRKTTVIQQSITNSNRLTSVSCTSPSFCVGTDLLGRAFFYGGAGPLPLLASAPRVSGTAKVGRTLTCAAKYTGASAVTYRWFRSGKLVRTAAKYTLSAADYKARVSCTSTASNAAGTTGQVSSGAVTVGRGAALSKRTAPAVTGTAKAGKTLHAAHGRFSPSASSYSYQWLVGGKKIGGATHAAFKVRKKDRHKRLSVKVTAHRAGYANGTATSKSVKVK